MNLNLNPAVPHNYEQGLVHIRDEEKVLSHKSNTCNKVKCAHV